MFVRLTGNYSTSIKLMLLTGLMARKFLKDSAFMKQVFVTGF